MRRYNIRTGYNADGHNVDMIGYYAGKWVKWEDVEGVEGQVLESIELECNCKEMFDNHAYNWICPAHGYKKR